MTATAHVIVGTVIAAKIGNPTLAIPIAVASHVVLDLIPHWDTATNRKDKSRKRLFIDSFVDVLTATAVSYTIIVFFFPKTDLFYAATIALFALLPDILMAPYLFLRIGFFKWAYDFGKMTNNELDKPRGVLTQTGVIIAAILLAKFF